MDAGRQNPGAGQRQAHRHGHRQDARAAVGRAHGHPQVPAQGVPAGHELGARAHGAQFRRIRIQEHLQVFGGHTGHPNLQASALAGLQFQCPRFHLEPQPGPGAGRMDPYAGPGDAGAAVRCAGHGHEHSPAGKGPGLEHLLLGIPGAEPGRHHGHLQAGIRAFAAVGFQHTKLERQGSRGLQGHLPGHDIHPQAVDAPADLQGGVAHGLLTAHAHDGPQHAHAGCAGVKHPLFHVSEARGQHLKPHGIRSHSLSIPFHLHLDPLFFAGCEGEGTGRDPHPKGGKKHEHEARHDGSPPEATRYTSRWNSRRFLRVGRCTTTVI